MLESAEEYRRMAACEKELWWYRVLHRNTFRALTLRGYGPDTRILDLGCGTGGLMLYLQERGFARIEGLDLSEHAIELAAARQLTVHRGDICQPGASLDGHFDVAIAHDVLYFLDSEQLDHFWENLLAHLQPGALILINMPALDAFRGTHDIAVGIRRRASMARVNELVTHRDVEIEHAFYWPFMLSLPIALVRSVQRLRMWRREPDPAEIASDVVMPPKWLNEILYVLAATEWPFRGVVPFGSSLYLCCRVSRASASVVRDG